jgi:hypothetical protein
MSVWNTSALLRLSGYATSNWPRTSREFPGLRHERDLLFPQLRRGGSQRRAVSEVVQMAPIKKYSAGSISCALWENEVAVEGRTVQILRATVERRHKDKDSSWKSSGSFSRNETPLVVFCLVRAFAAMAEENGGEVADE